MRDRRRAGGEHDGDVRAAEAQRIMASVALSPGAPSKLLSFKRSNFFNVALIVGATGVISRKWSPVPMCCGLLPTFSSIRFNVVGFILRS